jgi:hypothetical protein
MVRVLHLNYDDNSDVYKRLNDPNNGTLSQLWDEGWEFLVVVNGESYCVSSDGIRPWYEEAPC